MQKYLFLYSIFLAAASAGSPLSYGQEGAEQPSLQEGLSNALSYRYVGPSRGGRVTTVAGHKDQPATFYMGATGGGVWKTADYGQTWHPISDGYFRTGSIGAIRVAESDPSVLYVGTGSDGLRSNVIIGKGVYRSTDEGKTWAHVGLEKTGNIGAILIHPEDPDTVYVAAIGNPFSNNPERGIFRSKDGGSTWRHVFYLSEKTGAVDLEFAPDNPDEIYATLWEALRRPWTIISGGVEGGVYKTTDGGDSWVQLTKGLPQGLRGKGDLAVSYGDPNRVYVLIEAPGSEGGLYRSDDRGQAWEQVSDFGPIRSRPFYYTNLEAHPWNPDVLWGMAEGFWKSEDAGRTWKRQSTPHGDNHDLWINPNNPDLMIQSNDGGANVSLNGGMSWSTQNNQATAELYQVDVSDEFPYRLYAGQQDNTTISVPSLPSLSRPGGHTAYWEEHGGCETGPIVPKPDDPDIVFANCKGRFGVFNRRTGQEQQYYVGFQNIYGQNPRDLDTRFQRVAPIHVSPHNPDRVYHGSQFVQVTEDNGITWERISPDLTAFTPDTQVVSGSPITRDVTGEEHFSTLYEIQESPHRAGVIWAGSNDGPIHITRDGGKTWSEVTPRGLGSHGRVQSIEVSPHEPGKAYVCILRYQLGDFSPYVFRTSDYGATWDRITTGKNGIPEDYPVRVVREDPQQPGVLYAGTEFGMYLSLDDGVQWSSLQLDLPITPVTDIKVVGSDVVLSTMGRGFWILDNVGLIREFHSLDRTTRWQLFSVQDTHRVRRTWSSRASDPHEPVYPEPAADIDYYLAHDINGILQVQIIDGDGVVVRHFSSGSIGDTEKNSRLGDAVTEDVKSSLEAKRGFHRFRWDLRRAGPSSSGGPGSRRSRGPLAAPGDYLVRFWVDDQFVERPFKLLMDPRISAEGVTPEMLAAQLELLLQIQESLETARGLARQLRNLMVENETSLGSEHLRRLQEIESLLVTNSVRYSQPMLIDQLEYLYSNLDRADQLPGKDAYSRYEALRKRLLEFTADVAGILAQIAAAKA